MDIKTAQQVISNSAEFRNLRPLASLTSRVRELKENVMTDAFTANQKTNYQIAYSALLGLTHHAFERLADFHCAEGGSQFSIQAQFILRPDGFLNRDDIRIQRIYNIHDELMPEIVPSGVSPVKIYRVGLVSGPDDRGGVFNPGTHTIYYVDPLLGPPAKPKTKRALRLKQKLSSEVGLEIDLQSFTLQHELDHLKFSEMFGSRDSQRHLFNQILLGDFFKDIVKPMDELHSFVDKAITDPNVSAYLWYKNRSDKSHAHRTAWRHLARYLFQADRSDPKTRSGPEKFSYFKLRALLYSATHFLSLSPYWTIRNLGQLLERRKDDLVRLKEGFGIQAFKKEFIEENVLPRLEAYRDEITKAELDVPFIRQILNDAGPYGSERYLSPILDEFEALKLQSERLIAFLKTHLGVQNQN